MRQYIIKGGKPLQGEVYIGGAKNAALGILVAAIMANEPVTVENLPDVDDVKVLLEAMEGIGAIVERIDTHKVRRLPPFLAAARLEAGPLTSISKDLSSWERR